MDVPELVVIYVNYVDYLTDFLHTSQFLFHCI